MAAASALASDALQVFTDKTAYNVGEEVAVATTLKPGQPIQPDKTGGLVLRYVGDSGLILPPITLQQLTWYTGGAASPHGFLTFWKIPPEAKTGRYQIELLPCGGEPSYCREPAVATASFSVYRKLVEVERIKLGQTFYSPGDAVSCAVTLENRTNQPLKNLRVEFSDRYWPWIAAPAANVAATIKPLSEDFSLQAGQSRQLESPSCAVASKVKAPATHQYGVVVWDHDRKNVYDISFSELTFIRPGGSNAATPYPGQYIYPELSKVNTTDYRQFYPPELNSGAIQFDTTHTMFPVSSVAELHAAVVNPTDTPWRGVSIRTRWLGPDGAEIARNATEKPMDLIPGADPVPVTATLQLTATSGPYRARVQVVNSAGQALASNDLEIAANVLPKSILIFCAHEDDEGGWSGLTRAAIENQIPIHFVYFTSGDAGSCDRYYQHSCGPAEAENFGELRMEETRASLGHLGVPREAILFLGLPDGGSGEIWYDHLSKDRPYLSVLLASDHAPYPDIAVANLPYAREAVVHAAEGFIKFFQPEVIVTAHPPQQTHIDHIVNNYFVVAALQDLLKSQSISPDTQVLVDRVYDPKDAPKTPYSYEERRFFVSGDVAAQAQEAGWYYQSQTGNNAQGRIKDFDKLSRTVTYRVMLDWKEHVGWNEKPPAGGASQ
jgi:LmbE family N-acetylglucosaminyl deacetylase